MQLYAIHGQLPCRSIQPVRAELRAVAAFAQDHSRRALSREIMQQLAVTASAEGHHEDLPDAALFPAETLRTERLCQPQAIVETGISKIKIFF